MRTSTGVLVWIDYNTPHDNRTSLEKALWWVAYNRAQQYYQDNDLKDWASMLLEGINPLNAESDVQDYLDEQWKLSDGEEPDIGGNLRQFWGVK